uniref:SIR2 family NAD-dependent protein deacylase n=1 Tax=Herbidospora sakaeratensis TaxID=564415 RepID=UPI0007838221|nr:SIR2 family protein [Herbidospora sakaeratensis]
MREMEQHDWNQLIYQLKRGLCTPFVGAGASLSVLPSGRALSRKLAKRLGYRGKNSYDLPHVAQFGGMKQGELGHVKEIVRDELTLGRVPDFADPHEPHGLLAGFPFPVFVTTNFDDFIARSLVAAGKTPTSVICPWNSDIPADEKLLASESVWKPEPDTPLVYHLHGALSDPATLVVAQDDYHEFVRNLAMESATGQRKMIPPAVLKALARQPLLFVGYSLQDLSFRMLFQDLNTSIPGISRRKHVSIQLEKPKTDAEKEEKKNLELQLDWYYRGWTIAVFWGGVAAFCAELRSRMGADK